MENKFNPFEGMGKFMKRANEPIDPLFYVKEDNPVINPLIMVEDHPNDVDHFAIMRTTENGKYVKNGMLYFVMNGITIYTEINNVIFVDLVQKTFFVKNYEKVIEEIKPKNPEERQYIILYTAMNAGEDYHQWEAMEGRNTMYEWIRDNIDELQFNPEESYVLVDTVPYKDALTVSAFIKYLQNADLVDGNDGFDIDDYIQNSPF